jgi:puromycin-sensitive aminopeptidase
MATNLDPYRLPTSVVPTAYRIRLEPDLDAARFAGTVEIDVELLEAASEVTLNAVALEVAAASVRADGGAELAGAIALDEEHDRVTVRFATELPVGPHTLSLTFNGYLNDLLVGFYRSSYTDDAGESRTIATTQFEATDARRAFPCFDEPAFKATFEVTLVVPDGLSAFSNSPILTETVLEDGRREVVFGRTMKMSTYLVASVVGPFESTPPVDVDGVPLAVVTPRGRGGEDLTSFALEVGAFALRFFTEYFGIPYPGDKVDLVAVPDFAYGAMENLGCVTFRETALLVDPLKASQNEQVRVAMVIAHELAHMWFGDLVTMAWWEGIWLNEAFATFMQYVCCDAFRPEWKTWVRFSAEREVGLSIDGLHATRPIEFPVHSPADAAAMVDAITYQKGGSVLKMMEQYLGAEVFRDGIRHYLAAHAYSNTVTRDLWASLEAVSGQPVGEIMDTWILQGGHPTVTVSEHALSQRPFMFAPPEGPSAIGSSWKVPVLSRTLGGGELARQLLEDPAPLAVGQPALVNAGGTGVYRTSYETKQLAAIASRLGELTEVERAVLLGDTWALARAGDRSVADMLTLVSGLGTDVEPATWEVADQLFDFLSRTVTDSDRPLLEAKVRALLGPVFAHFGWDAADGEDDRAQIVRSVLIRRLGTTGADEAVRSEAAARFDAGVVEGDLADSIVTVVAAMNRPGDRDEMLRRFREAKDPQTEERYRLGITAFPDEALCLRTFEESFELFRSQDVPVVIVRLMANRVGGRAVWDAVTEQWNQLMERIPPVMQFALGMGLSFQVTDEEFLQRVQEFHAAHPLPAGQQRIDQSLERLATSVRFADRERQGLAVVLR